MLRGVAAQGVPFSGALDTSGIVSWGRDLDGRSWRSWCCAALARELVAARQRLGPAATAERVADAALDALGRAGLDVVDWHPSGSRTGRRMIDVAERRYLLPSDVETVAVSAEEVSIGRPGSRSPAQLVSTEAAELLDQFRHAGPARRCRDRALRGHRWRPGDDAG